MYSIKENGYLIIDTFFVERMANMKLLRRLFFTVLTICLLVGALAFYAIKIEPYRLHINTYQMETNKFIEEVSIVQISDIQIGDHYPEKELQKLVTKINELQPDIVVFTGDLYENYAAYGKQDSVIAILQQIQTVYGKYAIYGNRDYGGGAIRVYKGVMEESGFQVLVNEGVHIALNNQESIFIGGLDDSLFSSPYIDLVTKDLQKQEAKYTILLTHEPDVIDNYKDYPFDLVLAGHSHGGQVKIPFFGGIVTSLAKKYTNGFYDINDTMQLYVNTGIGTSRYPIRFMVPPEITEFVFNGK